MENYGGTKQYQKDLYYIRMQGEKLDERQSENNGKTTEKDKLKLDEVLGKIENR